MKHIEVESNYLRIYHSINGYKVFGMNIRLADLECVKTLIRAHKGEIYNK